MKNIKTLLIISALVFGSNVVNAASHAGAPKAKDEVKKDMATTPAVDMADGEVRKIDKENKKVTLKHGVIKNLDMPGMTMVFQVKDAAMLDSIKTGDKIKFKAEQAGSAIVVTEIQPAK